MQHAAFVALSCAIVFPAAVLAQGPVGSRVLRPLARGDHVRLPARDGAAPLIGHVVRIDSSEAVITPDDSTAPQRILSLDESRQLEVERGTKLRTISTDVGALLGVLAGASYYYFDLCRSDEQGCAEEQHRADVAARYDETYVGVGTVMVIGGLIAGGALGYVLAPAPHWEAVAAPIATPGPGGGTEHALRIGLSRRFFAR
jgi:hypothetical protein